MCKKIHKKKKSKQQQKIQQNKHTLHAMSYKKTHI